jgi:Ni2+-binding GTPase involved in maturation of urease and hydrogenase
MRINAKSKVQFVTIGGFLGAGKTTIMLAVADTLISSGRRVSVITNDQGTDLVDTIAVQNRVDATAEVTGGCFCCRFDELVTTMVRLVEEKSPEIVLAEAVGSCADLQATVIRPLRGLLGDGLNVAPLTVLVDPLRYSDFALDRLTSEPESDLVYLFRKQIEEADVIALSKTDLLSSDEVEVLIDTLKIAFPHAITMAVSARNGNGIGDIVSLWENSHPHDIDLDIDYSKYGRAEQALAWSNLLIHITAQSAQGFAFDDWIEGFMAVIGSWCQTDDHLIGHVKLLLSADVGLVSASLVSSIQPIVWGGQRGLRGMAAKAIVNARLIGAPDQLASLLSNAAIGCSARSNAVVESSTGIAFSPALPVPVHRFLVREPPISSSPKSNSVVTERTNEY